MTKVLITGTFDIIHPGHLNFISQARKLGDFLVIVVARDKNVIKAKGQPPYFNENERFNNLEKLKLADKVILGDLNDPYKVIKEERPDTVALGYDQQTFVNGLNQLKVPAYANLPAGEAGVSAGKQNSPRLRSGQAKLKTIRLQPFKEDFCKGKNIRKAVEDTQAGFLLIDKPEGWTSHDAMAKLRNITGIRQIGHTGTLDPFATGLLIGAVSNATKMVGLFDLLPKTYEAEIKFGVTSDTYDRTGQVTRYNQQDTRLRPDFAPLELRRGYGGQAKKSQISITKIQTILNSFIGKQMQMPPMYSAKKVGGKKLYELARKGIDIEREASEIEIYDIELLEYKTQDPRPKIKIKCSTGTYIRTLAYDIGQRLGTGAVLWELKRTAIGDFKISEAVQLNQLKQDNYSRYLIKPLKAINRLNESYGRSVFG